MGSIILWWTMEMHGILITYRIRSVRDVRNLTFSFKRWTFLMHVINLSLHLLRNMYTECFPLKVWNYDIWLLTCTPPSRFRDCYIYNSCIILISVKYAGKVILYSIPPYNQNNIVPLVVYGLNNIIVIWNNIIDISHILLFQMLRMSMDRF